MKKIALLALLFITTFTLAACNNGDDDDRPVVYVTVYAMEFLVETISGDTVNVKRVPGAAAHGESIDWSAKEIIDMSEADLLFYVNAGADTYIPENAELFADENVELIDMSQRITYALVCYQHHDEEEEDHAHENSDVEDCEETALTEDPHFWLDPVLMADAALFVKDKLIATYPENEELLNNKYTELSTSLEKLHLDYQEMADSATKPIITSVLLFNYWHERYDIEIESITNDAHSSEIDPGSLTELITFAIENNIMYVLFEKNENSPAGEQLLSDLQAVNEDTAALYLHGLGSITDEEYENGATYITIMYDNLDVLNQSTK